ncbi:alpha/beta hydrolase family protein [Sessilibacter corallicola]|uniref:alpha/beta hydrolase family protein n=1 Tax=Sessilibacter corallicola TaxID=2904075 RepID=UPI001E4C789B|nr:S9 family peptidase [Sessilibacter corallicola]MCE2027684.1 S9 family peptidase [Sessilibacter corallicola]
MSESNNRTQARTFHENGQTLVTIKTLLAFLLFVVISSEVIAASIEDYGNLPTNRSLEISPNGEAITWIQELDEKVTLYVANSDDLKVIKALELGDALIRKVYFATNTHIIIEISKARKLTYVGQKYEDSAAFSFNVKTGKTSILLRENRDIYFAQTGLAEIVGFNKEKETALMPAIDNSSKFNLYSVDLNTGKAKRFKPGKQETINWHTNSAGEVIAREDFDGKKDRYRVYSYTQGKKPVLVYENETSLPNLDIVGINEEKNTLIVYNRSSTHEYLTDLSLDTGELENNLFSIQDANIKNYIKSNNDELLGLSISGLTPDYVFFDEKIDHSFERLLSTFKDKSVNLLSYSDDFKKIVVIVSGSQSPEKVYLFDTENVRLNSIGRQFSSIAESDVADVSSFTYQSRDGLALNAVITWPLQKTDSDQKNLPTLIFPHGGPAAYDSIQFDWWAQYFASQGYLIIQPNFRGSTGFGVELTQAGNGKWGKEMQNDVTDALNHAIELGITDPDRVCIMGASYGGYSALAGGAFTPEKFRCVISVNGVSDIPKMLSYDKDVYGRNSWVVNYWDKVIANGTLKKNDLKDISPIHHVDKFVSPTLLIVSKNDTVVSPKQSKAIAKKLKRAKKSVRIVTLKGEDHWLSKSETRLSMLKAIDEFLKEHNPI